MKNRVTIYTTTMCPVCHMVRQFLTNIHIEYKEVNMDLHPIEMMKLIAKTKRFSLPQTNIDGEWVFGFDPIQMLEVLAKNFTKE